MKNSERISNTSSVARHRIFVPGHAPFLELRTTLDSALPYAAHVHSAFSLGLILQGKTRFSLGDAAYLVEEGDIVLISQGRAHSCNPVDGLRGYHMLLIDAGWLQECIPDMLETCPPLIKHTDLAGTGLFRKAEAVMRAILTDCEDATDMLTALLLELCAQHGHCKEGGRLPVRPLFDASEVCEAEEAPRVYGLAQAAGMRRESFSRAVRRKTGLPPSRYLHCLRMEKARWLLRQGKSIAEAALAAGYADQSHFHRMFVKFCAITPGRYRDALLHRRKEHAHMSHSYKNSV